MTEMEKLMDMLRRAGIEFQINMQEFPAFDGNMWRIKKFPQVIAFRHEVDAVCNPGSYGIGVRRTIRPFFTSRPIASPVSEKP